MVKRLLPIIIVLLSLRALAFAAVSCPASTFVNQLEPMACATPAGASTTYAGPAPIAYEGVGQASGATISRNVPTGATISANNDLVVIISDADTTGVSTLTCGGGCTNTFTKRITDANPATGEFYNLWTGLAGSETSYTITAAGHNMFSIAIAWFHKGGGAVAFDASGGCTGHATSGNNSLTTPTITTGQATATAAVFVQGSGATVLLSTLPAAAFNGTTGAIFPLLSAYSGLNGSTGFFGMGAYQAPTAGTFPGLNVQQTGGSSLNGCAIDVF